MPGFASRVRNRFQIGLYVCSRLVISVSTPGALVDLVPFANPLILVRAPRHDSHQSLFTSQPPFAPRDVGSRATYSPQPLSCESDRRGSREADHLTSLRRAVV